MAAGPESIGAPVSGSCYPGNHMLQSTAPGAACCQDDLMIAVAEL